MTGRAKLGVQAYADALLVIPKTLAANAGYDAQDSIIKLQEAHATKKPCGFDIHSGEPMDPSVVGVWDNYRVKHQVLAGDATTRLTPPHLTSPHLTSPHLTPPHLTSPHLTSSPH